MSSLGVPGLNLMGRYVSGRGNTAQPDDDIDRLYVIVEYPLAGRF